MSSSRSHQQPNQRSVNSKYISYLLRHDKRIGELVDDQGFISIDQLNMVIQQDQKPLATEKDLIDIATDESTKKRFEYKFVPSSSSSKSPSINNDSCNDSDKRILFIRALNGHSFELKSNIFEPFQLPPQSDDCDATFIFHVTNHKLVDPILNEGLKPMTRQFVHLYEHKEKAYFDGKRNTLLKIGPINQDTIEELKLYRSKNGYIMCPNEIPPKYINRFVDNKRG